MLQSYIPMVYMCAVLLVPIVPAYIIYKSLPSKLSVTGPFKGLTVNLTGAFAGYFVLVLVASGFAYHAVSLLKPSHEIWEVTGKVEPRDPNPESDALDLVGTTIGILPPTFQIGSAGEFSITVIVKPARMQGARPEFPTLEFVKSGYAASVIPLGRAADIEINERERQLTFKKAVTLKKLEAKQGRLSWER